MSNSVSGMRAHFPFLARTVLVNNNQVERAVRSLNGILAKEGLLEQYRRTRFYEKPTLMKRRINFERCKSIYEEDMQRKIEFVMRKNRVDPFPANGA